MQYLNLPCTSYFIHQFTFNFSENDEKLLEICRERGYNYTEIIFVCPEKLPDYSNKIKMFYEEHIHSDEEIRYCMEGSGYFDVRDADDRWIRILVTPGQMVIIPEGCYHRFTTDKNHYIKAMRLFVGAPVWTPYNRNSISESNSSRAKYVSNFLNGTSTLLSEDL